MSSCFFRVPNEIIRTKPFKAKRVCTQFLLNETRGMSDRCLTSIKYLIDNCGYSPRNGKDGVNNKYCNAIRELEKDGFLTIDKRYNISDKHIGINNLIVLDINADNFDCVEEFTKLTDTEFDILIRNNRDRNKETLLHTYLYIKSYYHKATSINRPFGCYQNLRTICNTIDVSKKALISMLTTLVDLGLLIKHYTGSREFVKNGKKIRINVPNIYIPNLGQSQEEIDETIKSTIAAMKDHYGVDEFLPFMQNLKEE